MRLIDLLVEVECYMDIANGDFGTSDGLCIFCHSIKWDGKDGIIHNPNCPIKLLREEISTQKTSKENKNG